jgi:hypothetical protein
MLITLNSSTTHILGMPLLPLPSVWPWVEHTWFTVWLPFSPSPKENPAAGVLGGPYQLLQFFSQVWLGWVCCPTIDLPPIALDH